MPRGPTDSFSNTVVTLALSSLSVICLAATLAGWIIPVEVVQNWVFERAEADDVFAQFEATGRAEAVWWLFAYAGPLLSVVAIRYWLKRRRIAAGLARLMSDAQDMLHEQNPASWMGTSVRWIKGPMLAAAILLATYHTASGVWDRIKDWPYYGLRDGNELLPNISESNREVIRYLRAVTPDDSRIFVASDQKLYFLAYYLYPRKILHRVHPDAEHLIARPNQERQLAAYRLNELPANVLNSTQPDYVLEYFEGPEYTTPQRNAEDPNWVRFIRQRAQDSNYIPPYTVVLRSHVEGQSP